MSAFFRYVSFLSETDAKIIDEILNVMKHTFEKLNAKIFMLKITNEKMAELFVYVINI
jgi:hypothetical protein